MSGRRSEGRAAGHVVVATGFRREAACLAGLPGVVAVVGGGDPAALRGRIEAAAEGALGIASFGMAGALDDDLAIGDWIVADRLTGAVDRRCDTGWSAALLRALPAARRGGIYADGRLISDVAEKRRLGRSFQASAVDMESHIAAKVATAMQLPFAIVRCVSDEAGCALPPAIAASMRRDGHVDIAAMLASLARHPAQVAEVARTTIGFLQAMRSLRRGGAALGPRLSLPG